jgi:hypothetical protein
MTMLSFACLAATATVAAWPTPVPISRATSQRVSKMTMGWFSAVDAASGHTYYYDADTGQSQWEPPGGATSRQGYGSQLVWRLIPTAGVHNEYTVRNGEEQALGRYNMAEQSPYVSRQQCLVQVAADGAATLFSIGKPSTLCRPEHRGMRPAWEHMLKYTSRDLADGDQISLNFLDPENAVFTVVRQEESGYGQWR